MHWNTVTPLLREILEKVMDDSLFDPFRLVGGTALSLQIGHRESVDIDLFTDAEYGKIDFAAIDHFFTERFTYVDTNNIEIIGMGKSYYVGNSADDAVKIDIYYADPFIRSEKTEEGIRLCSLEDIVAMKLEIISTGGRKKDFWDLHALHDSFTIEEMIGFYLERYEYGSSEAQLRSGLVDFTTADGEPDPLCLLGKHWELIKLDFSEWLAIKK
jgi:hypothetical protein